MKNIRVAICVPTAGLVSAWFAHSLAGLIGYGNSLAARADSETIELTMMMQETSVIHQNREKLVGSALEWKATHLMFLDDDMVFDARVLSVLLGRRQAYVACNYPKRMAPIAFTAIALGGKSAIVTRPDSTGLEEAEYTGFGVSLIEMQVFEKTPKPWFLPKYVPDLDMYTTEDGPFCERIRAQGFKVYVDHDASKMVQHRGQFSFSWDQWKAPQPAPSATVHELKGSAA
jgi:hypothetical protein